MITQFHILLSLTKLIQCRECYGDGEINGLSCLKCESRGLIADNQTNKDIVDKLQDDANRLMAAKEPTQKNMEEMAALINAANESLTHLN